MRTLPCIIDVGTGQIKMGFAGHENPQFTIPSCVGVKENPGKGKVGTGSKILQDLDFALGDEISAHANLTAKSPMKNGIIHDYTLYEKLMSCSIYSYLSVDPADHLFFLTESPLNPPENREFLAEIMFETFSAKGMYIGTQAVMALLASWVNKDSKSRSTSGIAIDSGHGLTHVIPIVDCYAIGTAIKIMPIAGGEITSFVQTLIRERESSIPSECLYDVAKKVKEQHCYVCKNQISEFAKLEATPDKIIKKYQGSHHVTKKPFEFDMSYERFLGPELFFSPGIYNAEHTTSLVDLVFSSTKESGIDNTRKLNGNIFFSGGSTCFPNMDKRFFQELNEMYKKMSQGGKPMDIHVNYNSRQKFAVYFGCSMMASTDEFENVAHTRMDYAEHGPSCCRHNPLFGVLS